MIIIGAKGHAKEIYDICKESNLIVTHFFDDVSQDNSSELYGLPILKNYVDLLFCNYETCNYKCNDMSFIERLFFTFTLNLYQFIL